MKKIQKTTGKNQGGPFDNFQLSESFICSQDVFRSENLNSFAWKRRPSMRNCQLVHICMNRLDKHLIPSETTFSIASITVLVNHFYLHNFMQWYCSWNISSHHEFYRPIEPKCESGLLFPGEQVVLTQKSVTAFHLRCQSTFLLLVKAHRNASSGFCFPAAWFW